MEGGREGVWHGGVAGSGSFMPPPPPPPEVPECRTIGAEGALRQICLI